MTEGQTEEGFIKVVLQPHLWSYGVSLEPKIVTTKRVIGGPFQKGGGDFSKIRSDLQRLLGDTNAVAVTTLFDFYGFPTNVPHTDPESFRHIEVLSAAIESSVADHRFKAYLQRHEFEAFLFVDAGITAAVALRPEKAAELLSQRQEFESVEDINLAPALAPSKRLIATLGRYSKPLVGAVATQRIGVDRLRAESPRFSEWLGWLESFGTPE